MERAKVDALRSKRPSSAIAAAGGGPMGEQISIRAACPLRKWRDYGEPRCSRVGMKSIALGIKRSSSGRSLECGAWRAGTESSRGFPTYLGWRPLGLRIGTIRSWWTECIVTDFLSDGEDGWARRLKCLSSSTRSRAEEQDQFALNSQPEGREGDHLVLFDDEIAPVTVESKKGSTTLCAR